MFSDYTCEFSKTDSYCVTLVSDRKSWCTISCIKYFDSVITVSRHDLDDHKNKNGVATDLFCTGVIGHPEHMFLN